MHTADAVPDLVEDAEIRRITLRATQCERLMCDAVRRGDVDAAQRYNQLAAAYCTACLDLLTR